MDVPFENPWFCRVWVVQEALLAQDVFARCGSEMISWAEIVATNEWLVSPGYLERQPHSKSPIMMAPIWSELNATPPRNKATAHGSGAESSVEESGRLHDILDVFLNALDLKATDPRDKLYALLAFGNEAYLSGVLDNLINRTTTTLSPMSLPTSPGG